ncbi:MAG TPA: 5'/3'-nucleotidase SurE [Bacteroidales bacterium]|nr:5'/3'-nucleotidase SurE [Bacteroidales bacterium]
MKNRKLILISNDDGIDARGLQSLIEMVKPYGDLYVVAPEQGQSGMSHSISLLEPLRTKKVKTEKNIEIISVKGTPVDCVKLAINQLLPRKPDLMVSGINHGSNSAISIIYSGTMGAAIEASLYGIPSIGFSVLDHKKTADFNLAVKYGRKVVEDVLENGLPEQVALNVNFPVVAESDFKGFKVCKQTTGVWKEEFERRTDPYGGDYFWLTGDFNNFEPENIEADEWALANNYASIVPVKIDFTEYKTLNELKKRYKNGS